MTTSERDVRLWDRMTTRLLAPDGGALPREDFNERTRRAREDAAPVASEGPLTVDLFVDPVCPYTWLVSRWLAEVEPHRPVDLRYQVMSLWMLNEHRTLDEDYRAMLARTVGPSRVATAVLEREGQPGLRAWHRAFGALVFDRWRHPQEQELYDASRQALATAGLPEEWADAGRGEEHDAALRASHDRGVAPVGMEGGTPILHLGGGAFFGPVLGAVPTGEAALRLFDGIRLLASAPDFYELKRTRSEPPDLG